MFVVTGCAMYFFFFFYTELRSSFSQTPVRRVMATVLHSPLLIANSNIEFSFPAFVEINEPLVHEKVCSLTISLTLS